jgi:Na+/proline symporter
VAQILQFVCNICVSIPFTLRIPTIHSDLEHQLLFIKIVLLFMKRMFFVFGLLAILMMSMSSCMTMKRDCQGKRHTRLPNGIYL